MAEVQLPQLGESVTEGIITAWLVAVGDTVTADQPLVEISTDKVDTEIPTPVAGTVTELRAAVDDTVRVGEVIAVIDETATATGAPTAAAPAPATTVTTAAAATAPAPAARATPATTPATATAAIGAGGRVTSPLVRRLLRTTGVTAGRTAPTGPGGRLTRADVLRAARDGGPAADAAAVTGTVVPVSRVRRAIARSMMTSLATTAQLTSVAEADVTDLMEVRRTRREAFRARHGVDLSPFPLILRSICATLERHPVLNAAIDLEAGTITYHGDVNLGIAVDTERGLLVPNLKRAQTLDVTGLALAVADLADRARGRRLAPDDVAGGTFTVTNTGSRGTLLDTPILNPPEVGILGTGAVELRPAVMDDGSIAVRSRMYLSLTYDHRLVDGADAARFLTDLRDALADPSGLAAELPA